MNPEPWHKDARCLDADPELFFPEKGGTVDEAVRVCADCDVAAECLAYALSLVASDDAGVWGGTSTVERKGLRRRIARGEPADHVIAEALAELAPVDEDRGGAEMARERASNAA